jgi:hypothetical protein
MKSALIRGNHFWMSLLLPKINVTPRIRKAASKKIADTEGASFLRFQTWFRGLVPRDSPGNSMTSRGDIDGVGAPKVLWRRHHVRCLNAREEASALAPDRHLFSGKN